MIWDVELHRALVHERTRFDLEVRFASDAERLVLHGASGAGKTQTLKMIAGIARPDRGRVVVADRALYDSASRISLSAQERRLGYVFQDYALFPHLTVRQNIAFGLRQLTALARALVNGPDALLLDEPFAALDKALARRLRGELKELQAQLRVPMLLITHDDDDLRDLAHGVVELQGGRVVAAPAAVEAT